MPLFTLQTSNKNNFISNPFIYKSVSHDYIDTEGLKTIRIIEGIEDTDISFDPLDHMVDSHSYWIASRNNYKKQETWIKKLEELIYGIIQKEIKFNCRDIKYELAQDSIIDLFSKNVDSDFIVYENKYRVNFYFVKSKTILQVDYKLFSFLNKQTQITNYKDFLSCLGIKGYEKQCYVYDNSTNINNLHILQRKYGVVDKEHDLQRMLQYYKEITYDFTKDEGDFNLEKLDFVAILYLLELYNSKINKEYDRYDTDLIMFKNQDYLSNVELDAIDYHKYGELNFPMDRNGVSKFTYNCTNSVTGRTYTVTNNGTVALQTLPTGKRDVLYADSDCYLIDCDYKNFEFDILLQKAGCDFNFIKDIDFHYEIVCFCLPAQNLDALLQCLTYSEIRLYGKNLHYSILYGMNVTKAAEIFLEDIVGVYEKHKIQIETDGLIDFISNRISVNEYLNKIFTFSNELKLNKELYFDKDATESTSNTVNWIYNHFGRILRVEKVHAILNNYIQATAADILNIKIAKVVDFMEDKKMSGKLNKIILQNHDSILLQLEKNYIDNTDYFENIMDILSAPESGLQGRFRFTYGTNWGNLS
jgi:hypothetical protein